MTFLHENSAEVIVEVLHQGVNVDYHAGDYVLMTAGFEVKQQAIFHVYI